MNISDSFFTSSVDAIKLQRLPKTFVPSTEKTIGERTAEKWFAHFERSNFDMSDALRCIWWDMQGIVHYELLERNLTITAERCDQQLRRLEEAINARPHTTNMTKAAIQELDWEILPHPPYSPDVAPSDYHLLRSLSNNLDVVSFNNDSELQNWLDDFFTAKPADFFKHGIKTWPNVGRESGVMAENT
jgi:hypothetical protein